MGPAARRGDLTLLSEYYGQSEKHFYKIEYQYISILEIWTPFNPYARLLGKNKLLQKLDALLEK